MRKSPQQRAQEVMRKNIGARIYQGTEQLKERLLAKGFTNFLVSVVSPREENLPDLSHIDAPMFILFSTPNHDPLGIMSVDNKDDGLIPHNSFEWVINTDWFMISEVYVPAEGDEPLKFGPGFTDPQVKENENV